MEGLIKKDELSDILIGEFGRTGDEDREDFGVEGFEPCSDTIKAGLCAPSNHQEGIVACLVQGLISVYVFPLNRPCPTQERMDTHIVHNQVVSWRVNYVDMVDIDEFLIHEMDVIMKELRYQICCATRMMKIFSIFPPSITHKGVHIT
ncbi:hypothetical protein LXL04_017032 [Taraxacum kok-saghyz]